MNDHPKEMADTLVAEHGLEAAKLFANDKVMAAQQSANKYQLSIWREVRQILNAMTSSQLS